MCTDSGCLPHSSGAEWLLTPPAPCVCKEDSFHFDIQALEPRRRSTLPSAWPLYLHSSGQVFLHSVPISSPPENVSQLSGATCCSSPRAAPHDSTLESFGGSLASSWFVLRHVRLGAKEPSFHTVATGQCPKTPNGSGSLLATSPWLPGWMAGGAGVFASLEDNACSPNYLPEFPQGETRSPLPSFSLWERVTQRMCILSWVRDGGPFHGHVTCVVTQDSDL